jgi:lysophospholipase L1-like esterase
VAFVGIAAVLLPAAQAADEHWVATWAASPMRQRGAAQGNFANQTIRQIVQVSLGGERVRIRVSNEFGTKPLAIGAASVALVRSDGTVIAGTVRALTFSGLSAVRVPAGAPMLSDPVALRMPARVGIAVSLYLPQAAEASSVHADARATARISTPGNYTTAENMPVAGTARMRFFLSGVEVAAPASTKAIVVLGDSIADGGGSTPDRNNRWPDHLARRLLAQGEGRGYAVANAGISGNRLLHDGDGASALARFDRDVLAWPGATHVIMMLGINDIGWPGAPNLAPASEEVSVEEIVGAYRQLIARAQARGLKIVGATLTPFADTTIPKYFSPEKEAQRQALNQWIRTGGAFDAVIDFDAVLRDPARPARLLPAYDSGDRLHPSDAGYKAMGEAVDLGLFK